MATFARHLPGHLHPGSTWRRRVGAAVLLLLAGLSLPAFAQAPGEATLEPLEATDSPLAVAAGEDLALAVVRRQGGEPVGGDRVDWRVAGPEGGRLTPERSTTSATTDADGAGIARTRFRASEAGRYTVTAASQTNPGCTGEGCAQYVEAVIEIDVAAAAVAESDAPRFSNKVLGAVAAIGGAALLMSADGGGDGDDDDGSSVSETLAAVSGAGQSALPNAPLPGFFAVRASNDGRDAAGVVINWTASGGATLSSNSTTTNSFGMASVFVTSVGPGPAPITITATRADSGAQVNFTAIVLTPTLDQVSGNGQSAPTNTTVPAPLVVRALLGGSPQAGVTINWTVTSGDATIGSVSNGGVTDAGGLNSATVDLGPTPGTVVVTAARADYPGVTQTFVINSTLTLTLDMVSGDNQTAPPNAPLPAPLVVNAQNNGNPVAGVLINWSVSGGAVLSGATSTTDGAGNASISVTSTGPGPDPIQITATRDDDPGASVFFTANIVPPTLTIVSGDNQSGLINSPAAAPLEVVLLDGAGQPVVGQTISWQVTSGTANVGGTSITGVNGHATTTFSYGPAPGAITIEASAYGGTQSVDFSATALGPSGGGATGGNNQTGNPGDTLPTPLTVTINAPAGVTDLSGVNVYWSVQSGSASVSPTASVTDASGQASTTLTLGLTPGPVTVLAQIEGDGTVVFNAMVSGTLVTTSLSKVSGDAQTLATGSPSELMVVELLDNGVPLPAKTINWSTNNGTLSQFSTITGPDGRTSVTVTPSSGGPVHVTASFDAFAQYTASSTSFVHNATISSIPTLTTDEAAVAEALDSACAELQGSGTLTPDEQDLLNQCLALGAASGSDPQAVAGALEEMLPDVAETQAQTAQTAVNAQFDNLKGRMATLRAGQFGNSFTGLALAGAGGTVSLAQIANNLLADDTPADGSAGDAFSRWGVFASGTIGRGENEPGDNVPSYDFDINGLTLGVDYRKTDNLVIGAAVGYTRQDTTLSGGEGSLDMRGLSLSGYASWYLKQNWYVDGAVSVARNRFDHRRRILYTLPSGTVDQQARADSDGTDRSITLSFGRDFHRGAWGGSGYGRLLYSRQGFDAFEEELDAGAGSGLGLRVDARSTTALSTVFGGKMHYTHSADWGVLLPQVQLEWQKEHKSDPELFRAFLIDDPTGTPILITGEPLDSSYFRFGVGLSMVLTRGRSGFVLYERMLGRDGMDMDNLSLGFRMEF